MLIECQKMIIDRISLKKVKFCQKMLFSSIMKDMLRKTNIDETSGVFSIFFRREALAVII